MRFYFDEAGDFTPPRNSQEHRASVAVGLAISNVSHDELARRFREFEQTRSNAERSQGEVKGGLLSIESRLEFCDILASIDGISVTPVTLDLTSLTALNRDELPARMRTLLEEHAQSMVFETGRESMRLLARQFGNLSVIQALRIYTWACCIREALDHAIIFLSSVPHAESWLDPRFEIDRVQIRPGSREERVTSVLIYAWLWGWSFRRPFTIIEEIHTPDHPFVRQYDDGEVINISKLVKRNLHWVDSLESWGIRTADIAAAIVYSAVVDLDDRYGNATVYAELMRSSFYGPIRGPGLITPETEVAGSVAAKYALLSKVMKRDESG